MTYPSGEPLSALAGVHLSVSAQGYELPAIAKPPTRLGSPAQQVVHESIVRTATGDFAPSNDQHRSATSPAALSSLHSARCTIPEPKGTHEASCALTNSQPNPWLIRLQNPPGPVVNMIDTFFTYIASGARAAVTSDHFGIGFLTHKDSVQDSAKFRTTVGDIGATVIRFPGGTVTEEYFDPANPDKPVSNSLFTQGRSSPMTPLSEFLNYAMETNRSILMVIPTYRYFDQTTGGILEGAEAEIRTFVRNLLTEKYGSAQIVGFEIGNEWYQDRFSWSAAQFGSLQAKIATWVNEEVEGLSSAAKVFVQAGRGDDDGNGIDDNLELSSYFTSEQAEHIDGVISHFYLSTSSSNPMILGGALKGRINSVDTVWQSTLKKELQHIATEWNVGEEGAQSTSINGLMRNAPLLRLFGTMIEQGIDLAAAWTAQANSPAAMTGPEGTPAVLTPTGLFFSMLSSNLQGSELVSQSGQSILRDASGAPVGYAYVFTMGQQTYIAVASGSPDATKIGLDLSSLLLPSSHVYGLRLSALNGTSGVEYDAKAQIDYINRASLDGASPLDGRLDVLLRPFEFLLLSVSNNVGVTVVTDPQTAISDYLTGTPFNDTLSAGPGADTIDGGGGQDAVFGGSGDDLFLITSLEDHELGDTIVGGDGLDELRIVADGSGTVILGSSIDVEHVTIGKGVGAFSSSDSTVTIGIDARAVPHGLSITGNSGTNRLAGTAFVDWISGGSGSDTLLGGAGDDTLDGGAGNDTLSGDDGFDEVSYASAGSAVTVNLSFGGRQQTKGAGIDTLFSIERLSGSTFSDLLFGNVDANMIFGGSGSDTIAGGSGIDSLFGGDGSDVLILEDVSFFNQSEIFDGGLGVDELRIVSIAGGEVVLGPGVQVERVTIGTGTSASADVSGLTLINIDGSGCTSGLILQGNAASNRLVGTAFMDTIEGGGGNDFIFGGLGDDVLFGGAGDDTLNGGEGTDQASYARMSASVSIDLALNGRQPLSGSGRDTLLSIEDLVGSSFNDVLRGSGDTNRLYGEQGADLLDGRSGSDILFGGIGNDSLFGGSDNDSLFGGGDNDSITGGVGNDTLSGGAGNDVLWGGDGNDTFVFASVPSPQNVDQIGDFVPLIDNIVLDRSVFAGVAALQSLQPSAFFAGAQATAAIDSDDRLIYDSTTGSLYYDVDGVGGVAAVELARLLNLPNLQYSDFLIL